MIGVLINVTSNSPSQDYTHPDDHNLLAHKKCRNKCTFKDWKLYFSLVLRHPQRLVNNSKYLNLRTKMWQCPVSSLGGWQAWFCSVLSNQLQKKDDASCYVSYGQFYRQKIKQKSNLFFIAPSLLRGNDQ